VNKYERIIYQEMTSHELGEQAGSRRTTLQPACTRAGKT